MPGQTSASLSRLFDMHSPHVGGSRGVARGEVFQHGKLVATVAQEGLLRLKTR